MRSYPSGPRSGHGATGHSQSSPYTPPRPPNPFNGPDVTIARDPTSINNQLVHKDKAPWFHYAHRNPSTVEPGNWNASGPAPMSLHFRTFTYRREAGQFNSDTTGMHTMLPVTPAGSNNNDHRKERAAMTGRNANQLTVQIYRGQSFSDTTQVNR